MQTGTLSRVAILVALVVATNYALSPLLNVKLEDMVVFCAAYVFGLEVGIYVGALSELIWGAISPYGFGGMIIPFLVAGEIIYAVAGWAASRAWPASSKPLTGTAIYMGAALAVCAFLWDLETNLGTALLAFWPHLTLTDVGSTLVLGAPFMVFHEVSDLALGALVAPFFIAAARKLGGTGRGPIQDAKAREVA